MKIRLQDYSLISNEWLDQQIEIEERLIKINELNSWSHERLIVLKTIKEQLTPSEKLAEQCWCDGIDEGLNRSKGIETEVEDYLNSEIDL